MFRPLSGFKAQYHYLTLLVASDFNEWKVLVRGPDTTILGARQFSENKAKEHAASIADSFIREERHEDLPPVAQVDWTPLQPGEWIGWRT